MSELRVLTVRQPWAGAILHRGKDVENRVRNVAGGYRGLVAIHVGLRHDYNSVAAHNAIAGYLDEHSIYGYGAIIGIVDLVDVHTADDCWERDKQRLMSLYQSGPEGRREVANLPDDGPGGIIGKTRFCSSWAMDGHHHLVLANPRPLSEPLPFKGALGLRRLSDDVAAQVWARVTS